MSVKPVEVLVVDDSSGDALLICQTLAAEPFLIRVHLATDGQQALEFLQRADVEPNLVILDLDLPKVSGLSFLRRCHLVVPIVVFSSSSNPDDQRRALELGAKEFVEKATDFAAFKQQVSQIVRNWTSPERDPVHGD